MDQKYQGEKPGGSCRKTPYEKLWKWLSRLVSDIRGQDQVEYAVFIGLIALVAALSLPIVADRVNTVLHRTEEVLQDAKQQGNCRNPNPGNFKGRSPCAP